MKNAIKSGALLASISWTMVALWCAWIIASPGGCVKVEKVTPTPRVIWVIPCPDGQCPDVTPVWVPQTTPEGTPLKLWVPEGD